jgi:hypothetical protein
MKSKNHHVGDHNLFVLLRDIFENQKCLNILTSCLIAIIFSLISISYIPYCTLFRFFEKNIEIFSNLLGLIIASIAIIYSLNNETIRKLNTKVDGKNVFDVLISIFTLVSLLLLLSIAILVGIVTYKCHFWIYPFIGVGFSILSYLGVFYVIFHLYSVRTFIKEE